MAIGMYVNDFQFKFYDNLGDKKGLPKVVVGKGNVILKDILK